MPVYVIHGALGSSAQVQPFAALLGAHSIELPGHGATPLGEATFDIASFASYVGGAIAAEHTPVDLFGYSMGGYVALMSALRRPNLVRRIMTLGTKFEWAPDVALREARRLNADSIEAKVPAFAAQLKARHSADDWRANMANTAALIHQLGERPLLGARELAGIAQPVRLAAGDRDSTLNPGECARIAALLPNGSVEVLGDTPHPFEQVNHAVLAESVRRFFL